MFWCHSYCGLESIGLRPVVNISVDLDVKYAFIKRFMFYFFFFFKSRLSPVVYISVSFTYEKHIFVALSFIIIFKLTCFVETKILFLLEEISYI